MKKLSWILLFLPFTTFSQHLSDAVRAEINRRVSEGINPSMAIGILSPDNSTTFYNFGKYQLGKDILPDSSTAYEIGSVTKTFTAWLSGIHFQEQLDQPINQFMPDEAKGNPVLDSVSLSALRNHISGFPRLSPAFNPDDWSDPFKGYNKQLWQQELEQLSLQSKGTWAYSNLGYASLGQLMAYSKNTSFESIFTDFFNQIGAQNSYLVHQSVPAEKLATPTNIGTANAYWHFEGPSRYAGGLISCTSDMLRYLTFQKQTNPLFSQDSVEDPIQTGINDLGEGQLFYKDGWFVLRPDDQTEIVLHNGTTGGFNSFVAYNKQTQTGIVMLTNAMSLADDMGLKILYPDYSMDHPVRTIAFELADLINARKTDKLFEQYQDKKAEGVPHNVLNVYWLERFYFGKEKYHISNQLSDIMVLELPEDWEVHHIKGQNLEKLQHYKQAKAAYEQALALNEGNTLVKERIAYCEQQMKAND